MVFRSDARDACECPVQVCHVGAESFLEPACAGQCHVLELVLDGVDSSDELGRVGPGEDRLDPFAPAGQDEPGTAVGAVPLFLVKLVFRFRGGDVLLDSLSGRSRHRGEVFEGAAQVCGGVVRAVRAYYSGLCPKSCAKAVWPVAGCGFSRLSAWCHRGGTCPGSGGPSSRR